MISGGGGGIGDGGDGGEGDREDGLFWWKNEEEDGENGGEIW